VSGVDGGLMITAMTIAVIMTLRGGCELGELR
jgi:hypothetical protein